LLEGLKEGCNESVGAGVMEGVGSAEMVGSDERLGLEEGADDGLLDGSLVVDPVGSTNGSDDGAWIV
jgi:hypothetical protein